MNLPFIEGREGLLSFSENLEYWILKILNTPLKIEVPLNN